MSTSPTVEIGDTFRHPIMDGNILFEVTEVERGRGRVRAVAVNEPIEVHGQRFDSDHAGMEKDFLIEDVQRKMAWAQTCRSLSNQAKDFWANVEVGKVLHYRNTGGCWVRGVVEEQAGERVMVVTALVGDGWRQYDLAQRDETGTVRHGYHASRALEGGTFAPNASCVFESDEYRKRDVEVDPATLPERSLTLPEPTVEEEATYTAGRLLQQVREAMDSFRESPQVRLAKVREILG